MSDKSTFSHITVNDDEEEVFVVGARQTPAPQSRPELESASSAEPEPAAPVVSEPAPPQQRPAKPSDHYEATQEDVDVPPMSGLQKGIIALAVVALIAFIVYTVAF